MVSTTTTTSSRSSTHSLAGAEACARGSCRRYTHAVPKVIEKKTRKKSAKKPRCDRPAHRARQRRLALEAGRRPDTRVYIGDCRELLPRIPEVARAEVNLVFADPPFNWNRGSDRFKGTSHDESPSIRPGRTACPARTTSTSRATGSTRASRASSQPADLHQHPRRHRRRWVSAPQGSFTAQTVTRMFIVSWCIWHYRFGQNRTDSFINSKVRC